MSLEQALAANTAAIQSLIEVWSKLTAQATTIQNTATPGDPIVAAGKPTAAVVAAPTPAVAETQAAKPETATESPSEAPTLAQLSAAVTAAATRNRDGLVAALAAKGVKRAGEIPQDQWAAFITEVGAL